MSNATEGPAGSMGSIVITALLHGSTIMLLLFAGAMTGSFSQLDGLLEAWMVEVMGESFAHQLPSAILWLMAVVIAFGMPALLLSCRESWQRLGVWIASLVVLALWAPVLCLASHRPQISMSWLAAAVAGFLVTLHLYRQARIASDKS